MPQEVIQQFIPRQQVEDPGRPSFTPLLTRISIGAALAVLLAWGGEFLYLRFQKNALQTARQDVQKLSSEIDITTIQELQRTSNLLGSLNSALDAHTYPVSVFNFLEQSTLRVVQFGSFSFSRSGNTITLSGEGSGYSAVAQQVDAWRASPLVSSVDIHGLTLTTDGTVQFNVVIIVKPELSTKMRGSASSSPSQDESL